jgi:hypothetical protein
MFTSSINGLGRPLPKSNRQRFLRLSNMDLVDPDTVGAIRWDGETRRNWKLSSFFLIQPYLHPNIYKS